MFALAVVFALIALLAIDLILYIESQYCRAGEKLVSLPLSKSRRFIYIALGIAHS